MTPAEAHVWIAVFAAALPRGGTPEKAITMADFAVKALNEKDPETLAALNDALRQGPDIP